MNCYQFKKLFIYLITLLQLSAYAQVNESILPIVLISGLNADYTDMQPTQDYINKYLPGTYVKKADIGLGKITSFWNMYDQAAWLAQELYEDPQLRNGCNIIAHSQGGLVARYFIQRYNHPRVDTFITMGSPHQGVFGAPGTLDNKYSWLDLLDNYVSSILYSYLFQESVSFAGYWHDTLEPELYLDKCTFLPYINNEKKHEYTQLFKENLSSLNQFIMINSSKEDIVDPSISCHFGFFKNGSNSETEELFDSQLYKEDKLGLKALHENGRLHFRMAHCVHTMYQEDEKNFVENILPFLTPKQSPNESAQPTLIAHTSSSSNQTDMTN